MGDLNLLPRHLRQGVQGCRAQRLSGSQSDAESGSAQEEQLPAYIGKQLQTTKAIRLRLDKLTSQHMEYIFDVMANTTQPIKNIMAYLRTTILNAPTTMEHYYQAQGNWLTAQNRKK